MGEMAQNPTKTRVDDSTDHSQQIEARVDVPVARPPADNEIAASKEALTRTSEAPTQMGVTPASPHMAMEFGEPERVGKRGNPAHQKEEAVSEAEEMAAQEQNTKEKSAKTEAAKEATYKQNAVAPHQLERPKCAWIAISPSEAGVIPTFDYATAKVLEVKSTRK